MRRSASEIIRNLEQRIGRLEGRTASSNRISATTFEVRVQEEVLTDKWRTVRKEKMTLEEIKRFIGVDGDHMVDRSGNLIISDDYAEPTQKLVLNMSSFIGGVLKGHRI